MQIRPMAGWREELAERAGGDAEMALMNIKQEFPNAYHRVMTAPGDFPHRPRERMPVFYGSYDWHSCVEMHWVLVRLLRVAPESVAVDEIKDSAGRAHHASGRGGRGGVRHAR